MLVRDISLDTPEENILFDEVLFTLAEEGACDEMLRFWESPEVFVVLGRIGKVEDDVKVQAVLKDGLKVLRRASGGGTVLQGKGCLNFTLILSRERNEVRDLKPSYRFILGRCLEALKELGVNADYYPISDIALIDGQMKISGNAQKRGKNFIMHHGTFLLDFDLGLMEKYLTLPKDRPQYRQHRPHQGFVSNIHLSADRVKGSLGRAFKAGEQKNTLTPQEKQLLKKLLRTKDVFVNYSK